LRSDQGGIVFVQTGSETARIDTSGNFFVNQTAAVGPYSQKIGVSFNGASFVGIAVKDTGGGSGSRFMSFVNASNSEIGCIQQSGTSNTAFVTSSDYRLKHDVQPMISGLATVIAIKPVTYKWNDGNEYGEGFIAHELQEVVPLAVAGEKDAVFEDGSIKPQGVDYSKIVVHLVAAIQELSAKNDALEARLAALEAK
jgi:hypothetical protein